jgi:hypothetical protein
VRTQNEFDGLRFKQCAPNAAVCYVSGEQVRNFGRPAALRAMALCSVVRNRDVREQVISDYDVGKLSVGACIGILLAYTVFYRFLAYVRTLACIMRSHCVSHFAIRCNCGGAPSLACVSSE